jgi:hypothetical protein
LAALEMVGKGTDPEWNTRLYYGGQNFKFASGSKKWKRFDLLLYFCVFKRNICGKKFAV